MNSNISGEKAGYYQFINTYNMPNDTKSYNCAHQSYGPSALTNSGDVFENPSYGVSNNFGFCIVRY
jgi:hypothetical protein